MNILLEIGVEEIPARFLKKSLSQIEELTKKEMSEQRITYKEIKTFGTPRRMVLLINGVAARQEDLSQTAVGPAKHIAYDNHGELTKAGIGFAKSQGIDPKDLKIVKNDKGEYVSAEKYAAGSETSSLLPDMLKKIIMSITFAKSMRWGDRTMRFARPLRWILALKDNQVIPFTIENINSGMMTFGHRFFGEKTFSVSSIEDYFSKLKENNVIVDIEERKNKILELIKEKCTVKGETVLINPELLDEVTNLIEHPYPVVCTFNPEFLDVPQEVLIITMETHQRYFPVLDVNGKLLPKFVVIRNGIDSSQFVKKGNEIVVSARLADARFFFYEDLKKPIESYVEKLKTSVFQKDLGTIYEKVERIISIADYTAGVLNIDKDTKERIKRTVFLSKADLTTNMIGEKEYTKLQGFMGMVYAEKAGEHPNVAKGIFEHYLPRFTGDILPVTIEGAVTAISDKIDTIVGCFGVGLIPSGSQDPYALRRAAQGVVNIILNSKLDISLTDIIDRVIAIYAEKDIFTRDAAEVKTEVTEFFKNRILNILTEKNYRKDVCEAVIASGYDNILDTETRVNLLENLIKDSAFEEVVLLTKRLKNISKGYEETEMDADLFLTEEEKNLYLYYSEFSSKTNETLQKRDYKEFFNSVLDGRNFINNFFDKVMVMDKDEKIKNNRLSLIKKLYDRFNSVAVISMINE